MRPDPVFNLADLFEITVAEIPDRVALLHAGGEVTYAQMNARANRLASALYAKGIRAGDTIGLYLMNGPTYLEALFAAFKMGAVPFNVNYRYGVEELDYLFNNAEAKAIIHGSQYCEMVEALRPRVPTLRLTVCDGAPTPECGSLALDTLIESGRKDWAMARSPDAILLQYTGGTTGMPKGVMWTHEAFFFACLGGGTMYTMQPHVKAPREIAEHVRNSPELRVMPIAPLMHGAAIWTALSAILGGIALVLDPLDGGFQGEAIWDRVVADKVNIVQIVGDAMAAPLHDALVANPGRWDLSHVLHIGSGGAIFSQHYKDAFARLLPNVHIGDGMGTSETGYSGMAAPVKDGGFMRLPADDLQQVIIGDRIAEIGESGYLARTGYVPKGYYNDPVKTAEIFREINGKIWVVTGDQARLDDDGMITLFGRGSTCINTGGEKVYPEEVEEALRAHPAILDAAVVGVADPRWGQAVSAVISLREGQDPLELEGVREHCRPQLAGYKIPRALKIVSELKRSPAGKQDYRWAKAQF